jgi:5-hydroxyisourate hydrolase
VASLSTHVLDTASGRPASGIRVALEKDGRAIASAVTDAEGRIRELASSLSPGRYRLTFEIDGRFFHRVSLDIELGTDTHYHVPALVSPFGVTAYRGT